MTGRNCWDYKLVYNLTDQIYQFPEGMEKKLDDGLFKAKVDDKKDDKKDSNDDNETKDNNEEERQEEVKEEIKKEEIIKEEPVEVKEEPVVDSIPKEEVEGDVEEKQVEEEKEEEEEEKEEEIEGEQEEGEEVQEGEEEDDDDDDYPRFDMEIDTDKTDMLEILQNYVSAVFPEHLEFREKAVKEIESQEINIIDVVEKTDEQFALEEDVLKNTALHPFEDSKHPVPQTHTHNVFKALRTFLSTLGLVRHGNQQTFIKLTHDQSFYKSLKALDKLSERETYKIGVVYVKNGQEMPNNIFSNDSASDLFNEFVDSLGWPVNLQTHNGFNGNIEKSSVGKDDYLPYYANATTEAFFHVTTRITTNNDSQNLSKKRLIGNDVVHIIWSEHDRDYRYWTITAPESFFYIIIYPITNGFFRIQTVIRPNAKISHFVLPDGLDSTTPVPIGPLVNGMVVDKMSLAPLVKLTALNACKAHKIYTKGFKKPYTTRKQMIDEIITKYRPQKPISYQEFLMPLFHYQEQQEETISFSDIKDEETEEKSKNPDAFDPEFYEEKVEEKSDDKKGDAEIEITEM
jgi:hypothetical protein